MTGKSEAIDAIDNLATAVAKLRPYTLAVDDLKIIRGAKDMIQSILPEAKRGMLRGMLDDMIRGGRLTEADIPDDYEALVKAISDKSTTPGNGG